MRSAEQAFRSANREPFSSERPGGSKTAKLRRLQVSGVLPSILSSRYAELEMRHEIILSDATGADGRRLKAHDRAEGRDTKEVGSSDYELEHDPRFLQHIEASRRSLREKGGLRLEDLGDLGERSARREAGSSGR